MARLAAALCLWLAVAADAAPLKVAAPDWATVNVQAELARFFADELARALRSQGLAVTTAADIASVLGLERQRQLLGCSDSSCLAEIGSALGCDAVLNVSVAKLDDTFRANVRVVSGRDGAVLAEEVAEGVSEKRFLAELTPLAERLSGRLGVRGAPSAGGFKGWWLPLGVGALGLAVAAVFIPLTFGTVGELDQELRARGVTTAAEGIAARGKTFQAIGWTGAAVGVSGMLTALIWAAASGRPSGPAVSFAPLSAGGGAFVLSGWWP